VCLHWDGRYSQSLYRGLREAAVPFTIFVGSALRFWWSQMVAKLILPKFGWGSAVCVDGGEGFCQVAFYWLRYCDGGKWLGHDSDRGWQCACSPLGLLLLRFR